MADTGVIQLTDDEKRVLVMTLKRAIDADRYPLSPRVMALKSILGRLEPRSRRRHRCPRCSTLRCPGLRRGSGGHGDDRSGSTTRHRRAARTAGTAGSKELRMKRTIAAAPFASFLAVPATADPPMLIGVGTIREGCRAWAVAERGSWTDLLYSNWVAGYMSGAQRWVKVANSTWGPAASDVVWVKDYCRGHPLEQVGTAVTAVLAAPAEQH